MRVTITVNDDCCNGVLFFNFCKGNDEGGVSYSPQYSIDFGEYDDKDHEFVFDLSDGNWEGNV